MEVKKSDLCGALFLVVARAPFVLRNTRVGVQTTNSVELGRVGTLFIIGFFFRKLYLSLLSYQKVSRVIPRFIVPVFSFNLEIWNTVALTTTSIEGLVIPE